MSITGKIVLVQKFWSRLADVREWWDGQTKRYTRVERTVVVDGNKHDAAELDLRLRLAPLMSELLPSYCCCQRCKWPYPLMAWHSTRYTMSSSCFPLCELCWRQLATPERRMPFYAALYDEWVKQGCIDKLWTQIEAAVKAEGQGGYEG